ncbi:hypothetical protein KHA94_11110 [Bacillus sp. FJAT-49705]|uniref:DUF4083 domain-containing protein n=1 Tax=Cytobacillus citreus TaxID=2833586 RepID=A0ABS5NTK5_9BACI|nr:hypothetical protein [Cytobacillus citreus]MBS4190733.1 hypothetical protein [Cytobacillus citreus]
MLESYIMSLFLYFPQDKTEYIPAAISFTIFFILCVLTFRFIIRVSNRQAAKAKELEDQIMNEINSSEKNS